MLFNDVNCPAQDSLPYGTLDLDPAVCLDPGPPPRVRCFVQGCTHFLRPPSRTGRGDVCPAHGIRCHPSQNNPTYSYADARRNIIVSPELLASRIVGHPFKYESNRLGLENSEDALSWNLFRSLQEAGILHEIARWITGLDIDTEPALFLWGIRLTGDSFEPWELLVAARDRFERNLPVLRPLTEPDIPLYLPDRYLILIEAKFTSPNPFYTDGPRRTPDSLTKDELLAIYQDRQLQILDLDQAWTRARIFYQLWRNTIFAEWMALADGPKTKAYHANLTRAGQENESCEEFRQLLRPQFQDRFAHIAWEDIYFLGETSHGLSRLGQYLQTKTARLKPAFRVPRAAWAD